MERIADKPGDSTRAKNVSMWTSDIAITPREATILLFKLKKRTNERIAETLSLSTGRVHQMSKDLEDRLLACAVKTETFKVVPQEGGYR